MKFITQDGQAFEITENTLKYCSKVSNKNTETLNLTSINSSILKKVVQYCEMHKGDDIIPKIQKPLLSNNLYEVLSFKDAEYITNLELEELLHIIQAAEFLGINTLVDLSCAQFAMKIRGKSSEYIKSCLSPKMHKTDEEFQMQRDNENLVKIQPMQSSD
ncbi:unnamed protein product (macronuclear) [Paramecium tetraurelia]|uniref:SKP1 component POZ domain-containing protein n=1 Tax=Paramecium tetraurelia TaxID=5888 RepID=A0BP50_PARTE|nr:uncharacterized protein GSPATT00005066001 [Paramecium tetraurelia]CAK60317.1 unnamed protein product [Paramecium tetraurelia]|eukprot:XP_001427715.1 hypothetical protein (macronuclear) [Paramecium tetraurelia strain d4-2]